MRLVSYWQRDLNRKEKYLTFWPNLHTKEKQSLRNANWILKLQLFFQWLQFYCFYWISLSNKNNKIKSIEIIIVISKSNFHSFKFFFLPFLVQCCQRLLSQILAIVIQTEHNGNAKRSISLRIVRDEFDIDYELRLFV